MQKYLVLLVLLLCHQGILGDPQDPSTMDWPSWLLVDPEAPRYNQEEEESPKARRITPKSVFIAPAFTGSSPLPDCAEGYKADSMGRCVKLVQLNHAAQLNFLLHRLNAMYSTRPEKDTNHDLTSSDSSPGPLHFTIPLDIPSEPEEEETKESVEVAVVMADVLKDDKKKPNEEKTQTIVAVLKTGKNGTELEELETASDLEMEPVNIRVEKSNMTASTTAAIKYDVVQETSNSTIPDKRIPTLNSEKSSLDSSDTVISSENDYETTEESSKTLDSAIELLEEVSDIISEDSRLGNTSRRNVSSVVGVKDSNSTEESISLSSERSVVKKVLTQVENVKVIEIKTPIMDQETSESIREPPFADQRPSSYVRFPSDNYDRFGDGNSGDSDSYEDTPSPYSSMRQDQRPIHFPQNGAYYGESDSKSSFSSDVQRRPSFWWLPPGWRLDPSKHQPMLVRFWARMPLLRDPVFQNDNTPVNNYENMDIDRRREQHVY